MKIKKTIIYLHRYPIEYESVIYPATRRIMDLLTKKYRVVWISFKPTCEKNSALRKGIEFIELPYTVNRKDAKDKWAKTLLWYLSMPKIKNIIQKLNPSFIVHKEQLPFIPSYLAKMKIPIMLDIGDWWWTTLLCKSNMGLKIAEEIEGREIKNWKKYPNLVLAVHSFTEAKMIANRGMDMNRIQVINHPSSEETYRPVKAIDVRKKLGFTKNTWVVAVHGIIHPSKGYDQLLIWWKKVSLLHKNWKLLIIGGTIGEKWCKQEIKKLGIENNTIMTGWLKDTEELNKYLNAADCLLVTRRNNQANQGLIPSSLFHSLSLGKPLIITGLGGLSEMVRNKIDGFSFEPDNFESFKSTLEYVFNNPKKASAIGQSGIKRGRECFDPEKCAQGFFKLIEKYI